MASGGDDRSSRSVFVGNIAFQASEDEIRDLCGQVGPVVHFKLVYDRETGRPRGFGFCEYGDGQAAEDAIRNLNGYEFHGRQLRVNAVQSKGY